MTGVQALDFSSPHETRAPAKTQVDVVRAGNSSVARLSLEPGWSWSECIKPVVGTESCQAHHVGFIESGQMHVEHEDGTQLDLSAGDAYVIEPGHNAWVVGDDGVVAYEFETRSAEEYARG